MAWANAGEFVDVSNADVWVRKILYRLKWN